MKRMIFLLITTIGFRSVAFAYSVPSPLKNIGADSHVSFDKQKGLYKYDFKFENPLENNVSVRAISIFIDFDPQTEAQLSSPGKNQCMKFQKIISDTVTQQRQMVPVNSDGPANWSCSYQKLHGENRGSFGWAATDDALTIKPGRALNGFTLTSYGLPGIRDVQIRPDIDPAVLPPDIAGDPEKQADLQETTRWSGKTVGPVAPPRTFIAPSAIDNIIGLAKRSSDLGWIVQGKEEKKEKSTKKDLGILNSLIEKLNHAKLEITKNKTREAIETLRSFVNEVDALYKTDHDKDKAALKKGDSKDDKFHSHLTSEAYALLKYNTLYVIDQITATLPKEKPDKGNDKDTK